MHVWIVTLHKQKRLADAPTVPYLPDFCLLVDQPHDKQACNQSHAHVQQNRRQAPECNTIPGSWATEQQCKSQAIQYLKQPLLHQVLGEFTMKTPCKMFLEICMKLLEAHSCLPPTFQEEIGQGIAWPRDNILPILPGLSHRASTSQQIFQYAVAANRQDALN